MEWSDGVITLLSVVLGSGLTMKASGWHENEKTKKEEENKKARAAHLLRIIKYEVEEGIKRCNELLKIFKDKRKTKYGIFTDAWLSTRTEVFSLVDPITVELIHKVYHRFHIINFHLDNEIFANIEIRIEQFLPELDEFKKKLVETIDNF